MRSTLAYNYSSVGSPLRSFLFRLPLFSPIENLAIQSSNLAQENPHLFMPSNGELFLSFSVLLAIHILFSVMHTFIVEQYRHLPSKFLPALYQSSTHQRIQFKVAYPFFTLLSLYLLSL